MPRRPTYERYLKRFFDLLIATLLLVAISWLFLLIVVLYLITFHWPILFVQRRIGIGNQPFALFKFRTLLNTDKPLHARRFLLGDLLRFTSLDELPQLFNVIKGDMSMVGPRPLPMTYQTLFSKEQNRRHMVRPGITGLAQVNGRNSISWARKFEYDLLYVDHVSFWMDLKILLKTVILILSFKKDKSLDEKPFMGKQDE